MARCTCTTLYDVSHFGDWLASAKGPLGAGRGRTLQLEMTLASYLRTIHSKLEIWRSGEADAESWPTVSFIQAMSAFLMLSAASPHNHRLADVEWMLLLEEYTLEIY